MGARCDPRLYRTKVENWQGAADPQFYGVGGSMYVQPFPDPDAFSMAMLESASSSHIKCFSNSGGQMMEAPEGCAVVDNIIQVQSASLPTVLMSSLG